MLRCPPSPGAPAPADAPPPGEGLRRPRGGERTVSLARLADDGGAGRTHRDEAPTDEALIRRLQDGDPQALRLLMDRYRRPLHGYLVRMLSSPEDAEDLFQDAFVRVLRHLTRFDPGRRFRPWLYAIATNLVRNVYRARSYREAVPLDRSEDADGAPLVARLAGRAGLPSEPLEREESRRRVREAVATLPEKGRAALVLYYFQGLSYEEVAQVLEIPLGTVKSRIHNAMGRLGRALEPDRESER